MSSLPEGISLAGLDSSCPTARSYEDRMIGMQRGWLADGITLVAINSNNPHLSPADTLADFAGWIVGRNSRRQCACRQ